MTFDMNRAWNEAIRLLRANPELLVLLAGLFVFVPTLAVYLIEPETMAFPQDLNQDDPMPQMNAYFAKVGIYLIVLQVAQYAGLLTMVALFARRRPTVGDAIKAGLMALIPLLLLQIMVTLIIVLVSALIFGLLSLAGTAGVVLGVVLIIALTLYLTARLFPVIATMIFEQLYNPVKAIAASLRITRGHGGKLLVFMLLLGIAGLVISAVAGLPVALLTALISNAEVALFIDAAFSALVGTILTAIIAALIVSVYRQLSATRSYAPERQDTPDL